MVRSEQSLSGRVERSRLRIRHLFLLVPWVAVGFSAIKPISDNSFLWHVTAGRLQLDQGTVLTLDPFSFTFAGERWRTQSWLIELLYGLGDHWMGLGFVPIWVMSCGLALMMSVALLIYRSGRSLNRLVLGLALFAWLASGYLAPRPVVASFALLAVLVIAAQERRMLWAIPLVLWVWAASHGSFVLGIGYLVLLSLRKRSRVLAVTTVAGVVTATMTAHGWHVWGILARFLANRDALDLIVEWAPPKVLDPVTIPFSVGLIGLIYAGIKGSLLSRDLVVVAPFLVYGLTSYRSLLPAAIVLIPWMVPALRGEAGSDGRDSQLVVWATAVVIVALPLVRIATWGTIDDSVFPTDAVEHLEEGVPVFHDDSTGGYLIFRADLGHDVYVDDRAELYGADFIAGMGLVEIGAPSWRDVFREWGIGQALVDANAGLVGELTEADWAVVYEDEDFVVLRRN